MTRLRAFFLLSTLCAALLGGGLTVSPWTIPATTCSSQFIRSIAAVTGVGTCAAVSLTADVSGILPVANGGTAASSIPNFKVTLSSNQTPSSVTKVNFDTSAFDVGSYWDNTNKYYKPLVAGTYMFCATVTVTGTFTLAADNAQTILSKNGTIGGTGVRQFVTTISIPTGANDAALSACVLAPMNGSTDTMEVDAVVTAASPLIAGNANPNTMFTGYRVSP